MSKYTTEEINEMKQLLAESEWESLQDKDLREILWDGCRGWANMEDVDVIEMYEEIYGYFNETEEPFKSKLELYDKIAVPFTGMK